MTDLRYQALEAWLERVTSRRKTCAHCGATLRRRWGQPGPHATYCGATCRKRAHRARHAS